MQVTYVGQRLSRLGVKASANEPGKDLQVETESKKTNCGILDCLFDQFSGSCRGRTGRKQL